MVLLCCVSFASAAVNEEKADADIIGHFGEYTITPAKDFDEDIVPRHVYDTIAQGETNWHTKTVDTHITVLNVDLNRGDRTNSLRLKIYSPDWQYLGMYFDDADNTNNGRIRINRENPNGIAKGTWHYEVYEVEGTEDYYI